MRISPNKKIKESRTSVLQLFPWAVEIYFLHIKLKGCGNAPI